MIASKRPWALLVGLRTNARCLPESPCRRSTGGGRPYCANVSGIPCTFACLSLLGPLRVRSSPRRAGRWRSHPKNTCTEGAGCDERAGRAAVRVVDEVVLADTSEICHQQGQLRVERRRTNVVPLLQVELTDEVAPALGKQTAKGRNGVAEHQRGFPAWMDAVSATRDRCFNKHDESVLWALQVDLAAPRQQRLQLMDDCHAVIVCMMLAK